MMYRYKAGYLVLILLILASFVSSVEGKRKRARYSPPLKIIDISASPVPFAPGKEPMAIKVEVELPKDLRGADLLEVSSFISFPTKRSIRFLSIRQPVFVPSEQRGKSRVSTTLWWDGTDQTNALVVAGVYHYEIRAKLMILDDSGPRTKMVSLLSKGTLEVSTPQDLSFKNGDGNSHSEQQSAVSEEVKEERTNSGAGMNTQGEKADELQNEIPIPK